MSVITNVAKNGHKALLVGRKFTPEVLVGAGVVGVVTAGVLAARATLKLEPIVEQLEIEKDLANDLIDEKAAQKEKFKAYRSATFSVVKLYGPSVTLGAVSVAGILGGHGMLMKRNVAIVAAYKAVEQSYSEYRKRVIEEVGEEKEREIKLGLRAVDEKGEDGKKVTKLVHSDVNLDNQYARLFGPSNANWQGEPDYNLLFLKSQETFANQRLERFGYLLLNDVYESLGIERTTAGGHVGWLSKENGGADGYVDFGIFDWSNIKKGAVDGTEGTIMLDFNVDGPVLGLLDVIPKRK